ncbi:MAG: pyruvate, phosphate dikinase [Fimbriimonadaceae bacterium]
MSEKLVYDFREGDASMRDLLGGKGANLAEMTRMEMPVPPGFTITTEACNLYYKHGRQMPRGLMEEVRGHVANLEKSMGRQFGGDTDPLLVSVRSGSKFSMPGMMDTILNLGLNAKTLDALVKESEDERFALDAFRRFIMMFSDVVLGIPKAKFEAIYDAKKKERGVTLDTDLRAEDLREVVDRFLGLVQNTTGEPFPVDPWSQLELAIEAVFKSWNNDRAIIYRRQEKIPDDLGTAVNVQAMVFGNLGEDCGTGVAFTRDPSTGEKQLYGDYLMNAQGEDVVAGIRTPLPISTFKDRDPELYGQFVELADKLEQHFADMQDIEFTIERGKLYMLQCRNGKRTGAAAVRIAVELVGEGLLDKKQALMRVNDDHLNQLLHQRIDRNHLTENSIHAIAKGVPASPGAAVGQVVFSADRAEEWRDQGLSVILAREETNPDDVHGMLASKGILTSRGGKTSHAAVVARGFGVPCVAGCEAVHVDEIHHSMKVHGDEVKEGDWITIDGTSGEVFLGKLPLIDPEFSDHFKTLMEWSDEFRRMKVRANADNPRDAHKAIEFGAEGIGLCRTEHMFFGDDRLPIIQRVILTRDDAERQVALDKLEQVQQQDFEEIFRVMGGRPVTIRLIDPPMHEFLPSHAELVAQVTELRLRVEFGDESLRRLYEEQSRLLKAVESMKESNPMMGLRGVRLSIMYPGIVIMQTRAILGAAAKLVQGGLPVSPEIMIPLVGTVNELKLIRHQLEAEAQAIVRESGVDIPYTFGTMIEIPRAALTASEIAEYAEFFSFGTNDLTQMTFGYSRDDAEGKFLQHYVDRKILPTNPFETIDEAGVGRLMKIAVEEGRGRREGLKCGICGEHGGDPQSIDFCERLGLDYVSCSPFRVLIARLAAAQAAIRGES